MKDLLELVAKALVDYPEEVSVEEVDEDEEIVLELRVAQSDIGKVIGKQGRTVRALRTLIDASGTKLGQHYHLEIME